MVRINATVALQRLCLSLFYLLVGGITRSVNSQIIAPAGISAAPFGGVPFTFAPTRRPICYLCGTDNNATIDSSLPISSTSTTTCGDVQNILESSAPYQPSCYLVQGSALPGICGCPTFAPAAAPVAYPSCPVCQGSDEVITNPYLTLNVNFSLLDPVFTSFDATCLDIANYNSFNGISPSACTEIHNLDVSTLCGCQTYQVGPSTCASATTLTLGETVFASIANITFNTTFYKNKPCTFDSPSAWYETTGTGGHLTVDTCGLPSFSQKISVLTGSTCDQLTCVGGNKDFNCRFTWLSQANTKYYVAISGYYGAIGIFNLTLTDQTQAPTISPTNYPTYATPAPSRRPPTPTAAPSPFLPTPIPTQYPTVTPFPNCNICGSAEKRMLNLDLPLAPGGYLACQDVEYAGLTGQIEPSVCSLFEELGLAEKCGCVTPTGNDVCDGAITVSLGLSVSGTTINATWDNEQICPFDNFEGAGVWYKFVGDGALVEVDTCKSSDLYSQVSVFKGSTCSSLKCVGTNSGFCGSGGRVKFTSVQGETYYVLVHGYSQGNFELTVSDVVPPANDLCSNAAPILPGQLLTGTTTDATPDDVAECGTDLNHTSTPGVWYHYKSSGDSVRLTVDTCSGANNLDTAISVYSGSCGSLTCVGGNDNFCYQNSRVVWESDTVTDYFILVHGVGETFYSNSFSLELVEETASPTVSPAPSIQFHFIRPCECPFGRPCLCFETGHKVPVPGNSFGGAGGAPSVPGALPPPPTANGGSGFPPPYLAPVPAPIVQGNTFAPTTTPQIPPLGPLSYAYTTASPKQSSKKGGGSNKQGKVAKSLNYSASESSSKAGKGPKV